jgi:lysozyme
MTPSQLIKKHEGYSETIYLDHKGNMTVGRGIHLKVGYKLPTLALAYMFEERLDKAYYDAQTCLDTFRIKLDGARRTVLIDMAYALGMTGLMRFKKMWEALQEDDYGKAADEILDSAWHRELVKMRGDRNFEVRTEELARIMKTGAIDAEMS